MSKDNSLGALWLLDKVTSDGKKMFSGQVDGKEVLGFVSEVNTKNGKKTVINLVKGQNKEGFNKKVDVASNPF